jgi:hypothetical protein
MMNQKNKKRKKESDEEISGRAMGLPAPGSSHFSLPQRKRTSLSSADHHKKQDDRTKNELEGVWEEGRGNKEII